MAFAPEMAHMVVVDHKGGLVNQQGVALLIAEAVLPPVYGKMLCCPDIPFVQNSNGNIWVVEGTVLCPGAPLGVWCPGGNAEVWISKKRCTARNAVQTNPDRVFESHMSFNAGIWDTI